MSYCLLNIVDNHFRFYYAMAESIKDSRDVVFIILAEQIFKMHLLSFRQFPKCVFVGNTIFWKKLFDPVG